jgi:single-stranded-DNA-specific exonuclease
MRTLRGASLSLLSDTSSSLEDILLKNRNIPPSEREQFFDPKIEHLSDPFLMPDAALCIDRILLAREKQERIVIFGDYDVDGVSGTALLVRFL